MVLVFVLQACSVSMDILLEGTTLFTVPWATSSLGKFEELFVAFYMSAGFFSAEMMVLGRLWWVGEDG